jgi:hypothetical protein
MTITLKDIQELYIKQQKDASIQVREYAFELQIKDTKFVDAIINALGTISVQEAMEAIGSEYFQQQMKKKNG